MSPLLTAKVDLLFEDGPFVESYRQWFILISSLILICLFTAAVYRLFKTQRNFTFDCVVISIEAFKVLLYLIFEFAYPRLILLMFVFLMQTTIRAFVCSNFFAKTLVIIQYEQYVRKFQLFYYGIIMTIMVILVVLCTTTDTINCDKELYSYHWFILDSVDMIQSILITVSALFLIKQMKGQMQQQQLDLARFSTEMKDFKCLKLQTTWLSLSYLIFVISDFIMMAIGNILITSGDDFNCVDRTELIVETNQGAAFLLAYSSLLLGFSFTIWYVFYKIPDQYGLLITFKKTIPIQARGNTIRLKEDTQIVEDLISIYKEDEYMLSSPAKNPSFRQKLSEGYRMKVSEALSDQIVINNRSSVNTNNASDQNNQINRSYVSESTIKKGKTAQDTREWIRSHTARRKKKRSQDLDDDNDLIFHE